MSREQSRTVFVVGAGASKEVDLPVGRELTKAIALALSFRVERGQLQRGGDGSILAALQKLASQEQVMDQRDHPMNAYLRAAWRIRDAMPQSLSIDNFIDSHRDEQHVALCGKLAIVQTILQAERASKLYVDPSNTYNKIDFSKLGETWLARFFERVTEGCGKAAIKARFASITFVVFNYDRCIEHFLHSALQNYYQMSPEEAADALRDLEVFHPYGTVGDLSWQRPGQLTIGFGAETHPATLGQLAQAIRTFTEGMGDRTGELDMIRARVHCASRLVFLGFAFHRQNMRLLLRDLEDAETRASTRVFGSTFGMSKSDVQSIENDLSAQRFDKNQLAFEAVKCNQLYEEYSRSLSFAA